MGRGFVCRDTLSLAMPKEPRPDDVAVHEQTDSPTHADDRNFYKVEKWTRDGTNVDSLSTPATASGGHAQCSSAQ